MSLQLDMAMHQRPTLPWESVADIGAPIIATSLLYSLLPPYYTPYYTVRSAAGVRRGI